jgi:uncharacterized protein YggE
MMRHFMTAVLGSLALAAALPAAESDLPRVTVFGTATTQVTPDQMVWRLLAYNKGAKLSSVAEQHTKLVAQVLSFLKEHRIKDSELQTSQMEFGENLEYKGQSWVKEGYFASTRISFRTSDLATYKPLWLGLAEVSGVTVEGVYYDHSKRIAYQNETRRKALLAAKEKAADLAKTLGSEIAEPLLIEEDLSVSEDWLQTTSNISNRTALEQKEGAEREALAPGTIPIRTRVKVVFRLVTHGN